MWIHAHVHVWCGAIPRFGSGVDEAKATQDGWEHAVPDLWRQISTPCSCPWDRHRGPVSTGFSIRCGGPCSCHADPYPRVEGYGRLRLRWWGRTIPSRECEGRVGSTVVGPASGSMCVRARSPSRGARCRCRHDVVCRMYLLEGRSSCPVFAHASEHRSSPVYRPSSDHLWTLMAGVRPLLHQKVPDIRKRARTLRGEDQQCGPDEKDLDEMGLLLPPKCPLCLFDFPAMLDLFLSVDQDSPRGGWVAAAADYGRESVGNCSSGCQRCC
jgi:hypothetical protein